MKSLDFATFLDAVCKEMEISEELVIKSTKKTTEIVDARSILIKLLTETGFYTNQIAEFMNKTPAFVRYNLSQFETRKHANKMLERNLMNVRKMIENK